MAATDFPYMDLKLSNFRVTKLGKPGLNSRPTDVLRVVNLLNYQTQTSNVVSAPALEHTSENESEETPGNAQLPSADPTMIVFVGGQIPNTASIETGTTAEPNTETDETPPEKHWTPGFFDPCPGCGLG